MRAYQALKARRRRARDPEAQHKKDKIQRYRGMRLVDYEVMLIRQDGRCAICGDVDPHSSGGRFCRDHDHVTGKARELLCGPCNTALGHIEDGAPGTNLIATRCRRYRAEYAAYTAKHRQLAEAA